MNVTLIYPAQIKGIIEKKLTCGWVIFQGRMDIISRVEERIYTPGTARSADFEIIGIMCPLIFGKKIPELKKLLCMPDDFERILIISFEDMIDSDLQIQLIAIKKGCSMENSIQNIARDISSQFEMQQEVAP